MSLPYDPRRPEVLADPYPVLLHLQDEDPVHWSEILGGWVLTRFDDVKAALGDPRLSSDRITPFVNHYAKGGGGELGELGRLVGLWAVFTDPPTHTRLRGLMNRAFTSRAVEQLRPRIADIVAELLEAVQPHGRMDVIRDFAYPLPITVIAEMIGVPRDDREAFKGWSDELAAFIGSALATPDKYQRAARAIAAMAEYFRRMIPARRAIPCEDIMSALVTARDRDDRLGEDELVASCILLLFAGHERPRTSSATASSRSCATPRKRAPYVTMPTSPARRWRRSSVMTAPRRRWSGWRSRTSSSRGAPSDAATGSSR
jgi:cytochrome P450